MRMAWDPPADAKLLRGIIKYAKLGKEGHEELAAYMGNGCTPISIKMRLQKLQTPGSKDSVKESASSTPDHDEKPLSRKASVSRNHTPTNGVTPDSSVSGTRKRKVLASDGDEDDDSTYGSPKKILKSGKWEKIKLENIDQTLDNYV